MYILSIPQGAESLFCALHFQRIGHILLMPFQIINNYTKTYNMYTGQMSEEPQIYLVF